MYTAKRPRSVAKSDLNKDLYKDGVLGYHFTEHNILRHRPPVTRF